METENPSTKMAKATTSKARQVVLVIFCLFILGMVRLPVVTHTNFFSRAYLTKMTNNARNLMSALEFYADDNGGRYPEKLHDLVKEGAFMNQEYFEHVGFLPQDCGRPPLDWIYIPGKTKASPAKDIVFYSPPLVSHKTTWELMKESFSGFSFLASFFPPTPMRVVAFNDGTFRSFLEKDFQELLLKTGQTLPVSPPANGK